MANIRVVILSSNQSSLQRSCLLAQINWPPYNKMKIKSILKMAQSKIENEKVSKLLPLKRDIVAGVTVLTLASGGSPLFKRTLLPNAGLLSMMATFKCFVNGMLAANAHTI